MKMNKVLVLSASVLVSGLLLQGCDKIVHEPTKVSQSKLQVEEEAFFEDVTVEQMDSTYVAALAQHYRRQGEGGVELSVTYDPKSKSNTAMHASQHIARISGDFRKNGVANVNTMIMPVKGSGNVSRALVSYNAFSVNVPDDCTMMQGIENRNIDPDEDYKLGCTRDALFAKQIANPKDLAGRADTNETSDGRRAANIVERYRTGQPNEALEGESATE